MSAPLIPIVAKIVVGAVVSKVVGKVTGNEKLGMIAGLATGGGLLAAGAGGLGGAAATTGGFLKAGAAAMEAAPTLTMLGGNMLASGMKAKEERKAAEKLANREDRLLDEKRSADQIAADDEYARTHQSFSARTPASRAAVESGGGAPTAASEYYDNYRNIYGNRNKNTSLY